MTIKELQETVDEWIKEYGVEYFDELTNTVILMEEVGEFSRLVARIYGQQSFKEEEKVGSKMPLLEDELSDVLFVLICLANQMKIDVTESMQKNLRKKTDRDSLRHQKNSKMGRDRS